jgi:ribokinase
VRVVADGAPPQDIQADLLASVDVIRADATEAALIARKAITTVAEARDFAGNLLTSGPELVAIAVPDVGDLLVWTGGSEVFEFADAEMVDPTGAGDAFVAGLISALREAPSLSRPGAGGLGRQLHGAAPWWSTDLSGVARHPN